MVPKVPQRGRIGPYAPFVTVGFGVQVDDRLAGGDALRPTLRAGLTTPDGGAILRQQRPRAVKTSLPRTVGSDREGEL